MRIDAEKLLEHISREIRRASGESARLAGRIEGFLKVPQGEPHEHEHAQAPPADTLLAGPRLADLALGVEICEAKVAALQNVAHVVGVMVGENAGTRIPITQG